MSERFHNPFQGIDIKVPEGYHKSVVQYSQSKTEGEKLIVDKSPFPRMIDLWFFSFCIAVSKGLEPVVSEKVKTVIIIDGSIFANEPWRIQILMLIGIKLSNDVKIVQDPRKILSIASQLAVAGLPVVFDMLSSGKSEPIWNLSDELNSYLSEQKTH